METPSPPAQRSTTEPASSRWLLPLALLVVAIAWRHQLGFWFTDTDTLADVAVARVDSWGDLMGQLVSPLTGGYGGLNANFYRPLTMLHFALQRALFGWDPAGWHAWDLALHLGVLGVFASVLGRMGARRVEQGVFVLLAGLHPVAAEVVPAVARNIDLLCALLLGASLLAVTRGRPLLASLLAVLALTSKEPAIMAFPVVLGLWWSRHGRAGLPWLLGPWVALVPGFLLIRAEVLGGVGGYRPTQLLKPRGLWQVLSSSGLDALATPWALPLSELVGLGGWARHTVGGLALAVLGGLFLLGLRRLPATAALSLGLWVLPTTLLGLTASYSRRLVYLPTLAVAALLAGLLVRGGRLGRTAAVAVGLLLLPGTPLWRPYLDWGSGAEVSRGSSVALEAELAALAAESPGAVLWLVDRPLRHNLDWRRAKFWQRSRTLNHGMGLYSLQAWLDELVGEGGLVVRNLISCNTRVLLGPADGVKVSAGELTLPDRGFPRLRSTAALELGWGVEEHADGSIGLTAPDDLDGAALLVFGRPGELVRLP